MISLDYFFTDSEAELSDDQVAIIDKIVMVTCALGMAGAVFMMVTYALFKELREFSTKLICLLSLSDFMASLVWFPFTHRQTTFCLVQSVGLQFFLSASFLWTVAISISLLFAFYSNKLEHFELSQKLRYYNIICWGVPFIFVALTASLGKYMNTGAWCFIDSTSVLRLVYYVPLLIVFIINGVVFVALRIKLAQHKFSIESRMNTLVSFYLLSFVISQLPAVINGFQHFIVAPKKPVFAMYVMIAAVQPLQGFFNSIVYGFSEGFIAQYVYFFEKHCGRRFRKGEVFERDEVDTEGLLVQYNYHSDDE